VSEPLAGVGVVGVAGWTFAPGAGAISADLGGDVIKVEPPGGDPATHSTPAGSGPPGSWEVRRSGGGPEQSG
jgi:crotonobetainyl-CoA:carnitine CoA-transferase CaiB-like acyl-CoA transferase